MPKKILNNKPSFGIVVAPSAFTVPRGWEFVLKQPFEGVSYIATVLHNAGYRVKIIDARWVSDPVARAMEGLKEIDVLGIATYEDSFVFLEKLSSRVKEQYPNMPVILGGSLVTSVPLLIMQNTQADIAVLGEGELTIVELMELVARKELSRINEVAGLCYKDNSGNLIFTPKRPQMKDLNSLPTMKLSLWPQVQENPKIKEILFLFAGVDLKSIYYPLGRLEKKGLLVKRIAREGRRPQRLVYDLTPKCAKNNC